MEQARSAAPDWSSMWNAVLPNGEATPELFQKLAMLFADNIDIDELEEDMAEYADAVRSFQGRLSKDDAVVAMAKWREMLVRTLEHSDKMVAAVIARSVDAKRAIARQAQKENDEKLKAAMGRIKALEGMEQTVTAEYAVKLFSDISKCRPLRIKYKELPNIDRIRKAYKDKRKAEMLNLIYKLIMHNNYNDVLAALEAMEGVDSDEALLNLKLSCCMKAGKPKDELIKMVDRLIELAPEKKENYMFMRRFIMSDGKSL